MNSRLLISQVKKGFSNLDIENKYKKEALKNLKKWLTDPQFEEYTPQIKHLINKQYWDYILDSFYQVIPFGTGGRRGEVGIGPNRINKWTIESSAQGHSQYLLNKHGPDAENRGVVLAYDIREFVTNEYFDSNLPNPVRNLNCRDLAESSAGVYCANGIKVYFFESYRTTPELSFAIRHLNAIGGDMFSASHNPSSHNGKKIYDEYGGQLVPPQDEELVLEVTQNVRRVKKIPFENGLKEGKIKLIGQEIDEVYYEDCTKLSLSDNRTVNVVYTPFHGCGLKSVKPVLEKLGFNLQMDPKTSYEDGSFENVVYNIPNPEVRESYNIPLEFALKVNADLVLSTDPDADRIGAMVMHEGKYVFLNGNEIGAILLEYVLNKKKPKEGIVIKTCVTSNLIKSICESNGIKIIGDLLVGFKYIGEEMNKLENEGKIDNFLLGMEESHGYLAGNYARDKDAVVGAIWMSELAGELKDENKTLVDYLNNIYEKYGYYQNYLTEIRIPGAEGISKINKIQDKLRKNPPEKFGKFKVIETIDWQDRKPIVSETDKRSKNGLVFIFEPVENTLCVRVTVRPSGTEPKIKMYFEIGFRHKEDNTLLKNLEKDFMDYCYSLIGVDFPERGYLLFWQLSLDQKLKYFEIEENILDLKNKEEVLDLLSFLGDSPIKKVNKAFTAKYNKTIEEYLSFDNK